MTITVRPSYHAQTTDTPPPPAVDSQILRDYDDGNTDCGLPLDLDEGWGPFFHFMHVFLPLFCSATAAAAGLLPFWNIAGSAKSMIPTEISLYYFAFNQMYHGIKINSSKVLSRSSKIFEIFEIHETQNFFFFIFYREILRCWLSFNLQTLQNLPFTLCWIVIYNLVLHIMTWPYYYFPRSRKRKKNAVILEGQHCYGLQMLKATGRLGGLSFHRYFSNNRLEKFGSSKIFQEIILKRYLFFFKCIYM